MIIGHAEDEVMLRFAASCNYIGSESRERSCRVEASSSKLAMMNLLSSITGSCGVSNLLYIDFPPGRLDHEVCCVASERAATCRL